MQPPDHPDLYALAADMGVTITEHHGGVKGWYDHTRRLISLRDNLGYTDRRCTLAHELGHARRGDTCPTTPRDEYLAHKFAAELLVNPLEYALAEDRWGAHLPAIAAELSVTYHQLKIWHDVHKHDRVLRHDCGDTAA